MIKFIKKNTKVLLVAIVGILVLIIALIMFLMSAPSSESNRVTFMINEGDSRTDIISNLRDAGLIRSELVAMGYVFITNDVLQAGEYSLNSNMSLSDVFTILSLGSTSDTGYVTFYEGENIVDYSIYISDFLNISQSSVLSSINDKVFIKELIDSEEYWFLTNDVLNDNIYYALEGYLFPDTYNFYKNASVNDVVKTILNNTLVRLEPYKDQFLNNNLSIHELITLASMVELESKFDEDRALVSGVFINRLNDGWSLGSDVTTFYGAEFNTSLNDNDNDGIVDDYIKANVNYLDCSNSYNTRCLSYLGLSVGPISNPSIKSIEAALMPIINDDYYFVAECSGKTHYSATEAEHVAKTTELKNAGKFCE